MNRHLTPRQIAEWFAGERRRDVLEHVNNCAACHSEVLSFEISLSQFRRSVRGWSSARFALSSAKPIQRVNVPVWQTVFLALLLVAGLALEHSWHQSIPPRAAPSDDQLLQQVDQQISRTAPSPMAPLAQLVSWDGKQ